MNVLRPLCAALLLFATAPALAVEAPATMLVIHGGAGLQREGTSEADEAALRAAITLALRTGHAELRSEEHTSELQSLMRSSYAVFCLTKKTLPTNQYADTLTICRPGH